MRKPVVGVMGGADVSEDVIDLARRLGTLIAQRGWVLLNGGRNAGVMAASAAGARQAGGTVIGILPDRDTRAASPDLDYAIVTGLGDARNLINVLSSDVVIACPGGAGTLSEVALAAKNAKPLILLNFDPGRALDPYQDTAPVFSVTTPEEAVEEAATLLERT
ncbi:MAG TPA: TIGR00725 family protein [Phycisphaerae bacterium]|nr:TIGR00725 family protein [Phycisphaerae bacterium]